MSTTPIDYDALAKQAGGSEHIDYDALASQHGGMVSSHAPTQPSATYRFVSNYGQAIGAPERASDFIEGPKLAVSHPVSSAKLVYDAAAQAQQDLIDKAYQYQHSPGIANKAKGLAYGLYSAIPFVGPTLAKAGEQYGTGDIAGGTGTMAGMATMAAMPKAPQPGEVASAVKTGVGRAALLGKTPEAAYESALKPSTTLSEAQRARIVNTGLQNEIPVTKNGLERIGGLIDDLNQNIKDTIAADPTRPIDTAKVASAAEKSVKPRFQTQVNPTADLAAIDQSIGDFKNQFRKVPSTSDPAQTVYRVRDAGETGVPIRNSHAQATTSAPEAASYVEGRQALTGQPQQMVRIDLSKLNAGDYKMVQGPNGAKWVQFNNPVPESAIASEEMRPATAQEAQAMKQGTYRTLGGRSYGELKSASVETQKALARGLKDEIAAQFPELNSLNARESQLLDLQPVLERAVNRISNHQLIGIGTPIAGMAGKAITGSSSAGLVAGAIKTVLDNPSVKSRLAIALSKAAKIPYSQAVERVGSYSTSLGSYAVSSQSASGAATADNQATQ